MSDSSQTPWSDNPYAPQIPYSLYFAEKTNFAGVLIGAIFYGIVIVLFFRCMGALLNPIDRARGNTKWGLVAHAMAMFTFATIYTAFTLNIQSISYIDNRNFPGAGEVLPPGPVGYQFFIYSKPMGIVPNVMFIFNNWLADGLLLYRCYVIYDMKFWVIVFPCLMYLASLSMGILLLYKTSQPSSIWNSLAANFGIPYFSISISLNVLLTLMIVARLVLHGRRFRNALGASARTNGLYKAVIAVLVESSAIYAVTSLLFIGPWIAKNRASDTFLPILGEVQVIAPFLIVIRVADRRALSANTTTSGITSSTHQGKSSSSSRSLPGVYPMKSAGTRAKSPPGELYVGVETTIDLHRDDV